MGKKMVINVSIEKMLGRTLNPHFDSLPKCLNDVSTVKKKKKQALKNKIY